MFNQHPRSNALQQASSFLQSKKDERKANNLVNNILKNVSNARVANENLLRERKVSQQSSEMFSDTYEPLVKPSRVQQVYIQKEPVIPTKILQRPKPVEAKSVDEAPKAPVEDSVEVPQEVAAPVEAPTATEVVKKAVADVRDRRELKQVAPKPKPDPKHGLLLGEWLSYTKPYHLTAGDIMSLQEGDVIVAVSLSDRLAQTCLNDAVNRRGCVLPAQQFLRCNHWIVYTHEKGFSGRSTFYKQNARTNQIEYFNIDKPFEFHVEYAKDCWFPLTRGVINRQAFLNEHEEYPEDFEMTSETRVGLRGPMIILQHLTKLPKIARK